MGYWRPSGEGTPPPFNLWSAGIEFGYAKKSMLLTIGDCWKQSSWGICFVKAAMLCSEMGNVFHKWWQNQERKYENPIQNACEIQVRLNRASKEGPFSAQSAKAYVFATTQNGNYPPKTIVSKPFWARKRRHAHDVGKNRVVKMCSLPWRGAHFHNFQKKSKKKRAKRHRKRNQHKKFKEMAKMKSQ